MGIFAKPPGSTSYSFKRGDYSSGVAALQLALNSLGNTLVVDGSFGAQTEDVVKAYQRNRALLADGVAGAATQARLAVGFEEAAERGRGLPVHLLKGVVEGESGNLIAAVNWSVSGGVDCGFTQRRAYTPFVESAVRDAFDSKKQIERLAGELKARWEIHRSRGHSMERSWRLAVLAHNWPYGADRLSRGYMLSNKLATWVPSGTKFDDGALVKTYAEWAQFYSMGSSAHRHAGRMVRFAFGIPNS